MKRVLLVCSDFRWYAESYKRAFERNKCTVNLVKYRVGFGKEQIIRRIMNYIGYKQPRARTRKIDQLNNDVLAMASKFKPDIVCLVLCKDLYRETILTLKHQALVIQLMGDTISQYHEYGKNLELFDLVYSYEWTDINELFKHGITVKPAMGAYDDEDYYSIRCDKTIDVSFVGKMYKDRKEILERLIVDLPDVNFKFYGEYAPIRKPWLWIQWFFNHRKKTSFVNRNTQIDETNLIYNQSKIVLDKHCNQTTSGWSSRLPEISATGAFQLVDSNPAIQNEFCGDIVLYTGYEDLVQKIKYYLANEKERNYLSLLGKEHVQNMTIVKTVEMILEDAKHVEQK